MEERGNPQRPGGVISTTAIKVTVVRSIDDFMKLSAVRTASAAAGGQECPFAETFEGNDLSALLLLGWVNREAVASLRIRFFADFAKFERLTVLPHVWRSGIAREIVRFGLRLAARKGYAMAYGYAREGREGLWSRLGAQPVGEKGSYVYRGQNYTEMVVDLRAVNPVLRALAPPASAEA